MQRRRFPVSPGAGENLKFWNPGKLRRRAGGEDVRFSGFQITGGYGENLELPRRPVIVVGFSFIDPTKGQYAGCEWRRILEYYRALVNTIPSGNKPAAHYEWQ